MTADVRLREILPKLSVTELRLLLALGLRVNGDRQCWPSLKLLAEEARTTERNVVIASHNLENTGLITVQRGGGRGHTNIYTVRYFKFGIPDGDDEKDEVQYRETEYREIENREIIQQKNTVFPEGVEEETKKNNQKKNKQSSSSFDYSSKDDELKPIDTELTLEGDKVISAQDLWAATIVRLSEHLTPSNYTSWFENTKGLGFENNTFYVRATNILVTEVMQRRFKVLIEKMLEEITGKSLRLKSVSLGGEEC